MTFDDVVGGEEGEGVLEMLSAESTLSSLASVSRSVKLVCENTETGSFNALDPVQVARCRMLRGEGEEKVLSRCGRGNLAELFRNDGLKEKMTNLIRSDQQRVGRDI